MCREEYCLKASNVKIFEMLKVNPSEYKQSIYRNFILNLQRYTLYLLSA